MIGNVVQERLPIVSQLMEGLAPCGILAAIQGNPEVMRPLFCMSHTGEKLDEDRFMNLFTVNFSQECNVLNEGVYHTRRHKVNTPAML